MSTTITVGLVGCASQKLQRAAPARDLYVSQLFRKAAAYAELTCDRWYVLSAKHGLIHTETDIEPYDMRLGTNDRSSRRSTPGPPASARSWTPCCAGLEDVTLMVLAGEQYRTVLLGSRWPSEVPMKGLGIGQQLGWLTARLSGELAPA